MRITPLIFLAPLLGAISHALGGEGTTSPMEAATAVAILTPAELQENSALWPHRVELTEPFELPDSSRVLPQGRTGILMRVEQGGVVIDFGRNGTQTVELDSTDTLQQATRIKSGEVTREDLFIRRMFNKFYVEDSGPHGHYRPSMHDDFDGFDTFLMVWADLASGSSSAAVSWVLRERERLVESGCRPLLFPLDSSEEELMADAEAVGWKDPTCYHWTAPAHRNSLALEPISDPTFFLIDRNGKVLGTGTDTTFLENLKIPRAAEGP